MDKTHVVTFRLDKEMLEELDAFTHTHTYWKRSFILVAILWAFFRYASKGMQFNIVRAAFRKGDKYRLVLEEITDETTKN